MRLSLALLIALCIAVQSQPPSQAPRNASHTHPKKAEPEKQEGNRDDNSAKDLVTAINQLATAVTAQNQQQPPSESKNTPPPKNTWNILVAIFTGLLSVLAYLQWRTMHRQSEYLRSAERAHVDLDFVGDKDAYTIMIANYGKSIANIVEYSFSHGAYPISESDLSPEKAATLHEDFMPMNQILPPTDGGMKQFWKFDVQNMLAGETKQDGRKIIIRGTIVYFDIFGGEHETEVVYASWGPTLKNLPEHNRYT